MSLLKPISFLVLVFLFFSCDEKQSKDENSAASPSEEIELTKSEKIINEAIEAHGGDLYASAHYAFIFRGRQFEFKNDGNNYEYTKTTKSGDSTTIDVLINGKPNRTINGKAIELTEKERTSGTSGINSVIYFATLPHKLNDKAVHSKYIESISIKDKNYDVIEITFDQAGGGEDHDDEYCYWINKETKKIDYLAYNYSVNDGGVRFRSAYNTRVVDGITFQDYVNYEAKVGTDLKDLPALYEAGKLKEISRIDTEKVVDLKGK